MHHYFLTNFFQVNTQNNIYYFGYREGWGDNKEKNKRRESEDIELGRGFRNSCTTFEVEMIFKNHLPYIYIHIPKGAGVKNETKSPNIYVILF